jgi:nucleotide-binding universal stress UspA family protein
MKIIVAVDGSEHSLRAVAWCATYAEKLGAEVIAVHAVELPVYAASGMGFSPMPIVFTPEEEEQLRQVLADQWCEPLARMNVTFKAVVIEGYPSNVICALADAEDADLVVVGRRGRGGFAEMVLGSTSHQLAHHVGRPLVIVP